jgi:hypothetical protein
MSKRTNTVMAGGKRMTSGECRRSPARTQKLPGTTGIQLKAVNLHPFALSVACAAGGVEAPPYPSERFSTAEGLVIQ